MVKNVALYKAMVVSVYYSENGSSAIIRFQPLNIVMHKYNHCSIVTYLALTVDGYRTNSRLKMIKRTIYGRCGKRLMEVKLRYMGSGENG